jgi:hypothetical protein
MGLQAVDERVAEAIAILHGRGLSYADVRRALRPLARRLGVAAPSYTTVRRIAITERIIADARAEATERIVAKLLQGGFPSPYELECLREARHYSELVRTLVP